MSQSISIITICLNNKEGLRDTIESVMKQDVEVEYIIVDGGSEDGSLEMLNDYLSSINKLIVGEDSGIYDAMNLGIRNATKEIVGIINAGDTYAENILSSVVNVFKNSSADIVHGDMIFKDKFLSKEYIRLGTIRGVSGEKLGEFINHPTFFVKRECYLSHGFFDDKLPVLADYEIMLRFYRSRCVFKYLPSVLATFELGGKSNVNDISRLVSILKQYISVFVRHNINFKSYIGFILTYAVTRLIKILLINAGLEKIAKYLGEVRRSVFK